MPTAIETARNGTVRLCALGTPKASALATPKRAGSEPRITPDFFLQVVALAPGVVGPLQGMRSQIHRIGRQALGGAQHTFLHPLAAKPVFRTATTLQPGADADTGHLGQYHVRIGSVGLQAVDSVMRVDQLV